MIDFKTTYSNLCEWLLEYHNPLHLVYKNIPVGKFKRDNWVHNGEWLQFKKD